MAVLLTGSTGFLGSLIKTSLLASGFDVTTLGRKGCDLCVDLTKPFQIKKNFKLVIHCAGLAHINPKNQLEREAFFEVNYQGTKHLLDALKTPPEQLIFISTVAVYGRQEGQQINEGYRTEAVDPYGLSKVLAENHILGWSSVKKTKVLILRLPLLIGTGAPGNFGAMVRAINNGWYFRIGKGHARRSMVLAMDVASYIPTFTNKTGVFNLTDGFHPRFCELENAIFQTLGKKKPLVLPVPLAQLAACAASGAEKVIRKELPLNLKKLRKMMCTLTFCDQKARRELQWSAQPVLNHLKGNI